MRNWTAMPAFHGLDLSESFISSWEHHENSLLVEADFVLTPDHPSFRPPVPDEWACFKRGKLTFPNVRSTKGLRSMAEVRPAIDATGERDYGHFDSFVERAPGTFEVSGDFGTFTVESEQPIVEIRE
jgi:hypothetical protein